MAKKEKEEKVGKISIKDINSIINKKVGINIASSLNDDSPSEVKEWIPSGSRWLDSIICKGKMAGIPVGRIIELAGESASGKSYLAAQIAKQAQLIGIHPVYFDSESSIDPEFLKKIGMDLDKFTLSIEFVLKTIDELLGCAEGIKYLFIWDSYANTACEADLIEEEFNPQSSMAKGPRIMSMGLKKLTIPIANTQSTLLVLNQLRTNIGENSKFVPFFAPGGKALQYAYSLRIWLTARKAKDSCINDQKGYRIGSEVKAKLVKSRFGTENREMTMKIVWGADPVGIQDELSWLEAVSSSSRYRTGGPWRYIISPSDGSEMKFSSKDEDGHKGWLEQMKNENFRKIVLEIMDEHVIQKFSDKTENANKFYSIDDDEEKV